MRFQPVPVAASGPQTFRCCRCFCKVTQHPEEIVAGCTARTSDYRRGTVWADLDGEAFVEYYCSPCKDQTLTEARKERVHHFRLPVTRGELP